MTDLTQLIEDPTLFSRLSEAEQLACRIGLRDLALSGEAPEQCRAAAAVMPDQPVDEVEGMALSFHPSARFSIARFIDASHLEPAWSHLFARPAAELPEQAAAFLDPQELHFRSFEGIVSLDRLLERTQLSLKLRPLPGPGLEGVMRYRAAASAQTRAALTGIDRLGLYVPPLNAGSRGGERLIFHSAVLSQALTEAVRAALPRGERADFSHINPVFRLNRFAPGDAPFSSHYDTPYRDAARGHASRYTLLLYVTGGVGVAGASPLRIEEMEFAEIAPMTVVIFPQWLEHAGAPYAEGDKLFLRTELIFKEPDVVAAPDIAALFSKACYMSGEVAFSPELEGYTHRCYDRVAAAHWAGLQPAEEEVFLHKVFRDAHFVTNGFDYWFPANSGLSLGGCAALALLDYFNGKLEGSAFRKQCQHTVIDDQKPGTGAAWVWDLLSVHQTTPPAEPPLGTLDLDALLPPAEDPDPEICCPFHRWESFEPSRNDEVLGFFSSAQAILRPLLEGAPVLMMGREVLLNAERFVVRGDMLHVLTDKAPAPVNFAACWNDETVGANYVEVEATLEAPVALVPPIRFYRSAKGIHLMLDFFRNDWMVARREHALPIPRILSHAELTEASSFWEESPWLDAAAPILEEAGEDVEGRWRG
ncbi:MAG: hypothetical protein ACI8S6_000848 [Myxococcota bacterium]|jgi:hypothetical protein